jgi:hypothetical protein
MQRWAYVVDKQQEKNQEEVAKKRWCVGGIFFRTDYKVKGPVLLLTLYLLTH